MEEIMMKIHGIGTRMIVLIAKEKRKIEGIAQALATASEVKNHPSIQGQEAAVRSASVKAGAAVEKNAKKNIEAGAEKAGLIVPAAEAEAEEAAAAAPLLQHVHTHLGTTAD